MFQLSSTFQTRSTSFIRTSFVNYSRRRLRPQTFNCVRKLLSAERFSTVFSKMFASQSLNRPFTVCIEGNIASGKSTFLRNFEQFSDIMVLKEPVDLWQNVDGVNLFNLMYKDPSRWACLFQSYVQLTFLDLHAKQTDLPYKIMERSMYSAKCFIENMRRENFVQDIESAVLEKWFEWFSKNHCIDIDLIVYLRTSPEVVYERMKNRARKEEQCVPLEYLEQLHKIHDDWLLHRTLFNVPAPVILLNGDQNLEDMLVEFKRCKKNIDSRLYDKRAKLANTI